jgi:hypothetical protein
LPEILYGSDSLGESLLPLKLNWELTPVAASNLSASPGPRKARLTFEDASFSEAGQVIYTYYKIDYRWQRDHWQCTNLTCDVQRPELTKLDQIDFNAVLMHDAAENFITLIKLKRAQAETQLRSNYPLGELLRSANLY